MKESRRCVRSVEIEAERDLRIFKYLKNIGCKDPEDSGFVSFTIPYAERYHHCFCFYSIIKEEFADKYKYVCHYILSDIPCSNSDVLCVTTESDITRDPQYTHRFFGTHKVGKCPFCDYR